MRVNVSTAKAILTSALHDKRRSLKIIETECVQLENTGKFEKKFIEDYKEKIREEIAGFEYCLDKIDEV
jgi:hypothetical protein